MTIFPTSPSRPKQRLIDRVANNNGKRPAPIRTQSEAHAAEDPVDFSQPLAHVRHKSTATSSKLARLSVTPTSSPRLPFSPTGSPGGDSPSSARRSIESYRERRSIDSHRERRESQGASSTINTGQDAAVCSEDVLHFDFSVIDYELDRARRLGSGLWSDVLLCESAAPSTGELDLHQLPPDTPRRQPAFSSAAVFAVKVPSRRDAVPVLKHEATILTHIHSFAESDQYTVPFFGLDVRNQALLFEAVVGGSLEDLIKRLTHMTEVTRHREVVSLFPSLSIDLISGLAFLHDADVIHADIKPANILLDVSDHYSLPTPVIRARYIDFSAALIDGDDATSGAGGGTWDYMAPEQIRARAKPTFASDVWSLGISLLTIITLRSPYSAQCGNNAFMLREAIKSGDPLGFARVDPTGKDRMMACQEYIDWCKLALLKDSEKRVTAGSWRKWLEMRIE